MFAARVIGQQARSLPKWTRFRCVSTLEGNPYIYVFPNAGPTAGSHILSLLPSEPVNPDLAIGLSSQLPPTTDSFRENPKFLEIVQEVCSEHAHEDPDAQSQAQVMVSMAGANLNSGGVLLAGNRRRGTRRRGEAGDSNSGASGQGGAGSGGRGGWIHVSDSRRPPDYGRIAWPEDMFGSLEVDGNGQFVDGNGNYQPSGTYRVMTRDGIFGLSPFLREKLVKRLQELETKQSS
ncbi:hypothetical protein N7508_010783 [Penicillium antarcticum]|uniref:uncharacterized protein n=1 Tax=Penicillium antarcticum TaxID=416450 RepID=UPI00239ACB41|nr:uncharacterized protein N7508_010783 [Penicillium antarcticum]KAJ5295962.1 hypothetical protein N7508_010783 [Penicillium antarcticum]